MALVLYVAGPMSGDIQVNVQSGIEIGNMLLDMGITIYLPHLNYFMHRQQYREYEEWLTHCFNWIDKCDALYRMLGKSPGADREVEYAFEAGKPILRSLGEVKQWVSH